MMTRLPERLVDYRLILAFFSLVLIAGLSAGLSKLRFESDYKIFFSDDNPQLLAHLDNQDRYTKSDNVTFVVAPKDEQIFTPTTLTSIIKLTDESWKIPYSARVDSITNYQHTWVDEDDLIVEDLVSSPETLSQEKIDSLKEIALAEPLLVNLLISNRAHATAVSVDLNLPDIQAEADQATHDLVEYARALRDRLETENPNLKIYLIGQTMVNKTFNEMSIQDMTFLIPLMFVIIIILLQLILRSFVGTFATVMLIGLSVLATQGFMSWVGFAVNQINVTCPIIILTLAVCDAVHIMNGYLYKLSEGDSRVNAMKDSLSTNLKPVFLTSLTTAIGFMSMNFSDSPPFQELGSISAFGVMITFVFSMTLFPALVLLVPHKARQIKTSSDTMTVSEKIGAFSINYHNPIFFSLLIIAVILVSFTFKNELNDDTVEYFHEDVPFRQAADYAQKNLTGFDQISYSLNSGESNGVNDPAYLKKVDDFATWYLAQPEVVHVSSFTSIIKRLNQNMHNNDPAWHRLPERRDLTAQYILLYEMSLPYGLDLNNQIDSNKSSLRLTVRIKDQKAQEIIDIDLRAQAWLEENAPELVAHGTSLSIMFANIGQRNIESMLTGSIIALILVTLTLTISLRSLRYGLISLIPNAFPAGIAFGLWGIFVGQVNLAVAVIFAITLGIVVDDTVHFITKYLHAKEHYKANAQKAIMYAFSRVGKPIITTTIVLSAGFFVLAFSSFDVNASMGLMVGITIIIALVWDFLFLPALLIKVDGNEPETDIESSLDALNTFDESTKATGSP
jgi:predicted RND superfamily exporter protein